MARLNENSTIRWKELLITFRASGRPVCGIAGVIIADQRHVEPAVRKMMRALVHRGPDDEGYEELELGAGSAVPVAGFGFRRLSILDLSPAGHQPMFNPATGDCLIFNGEIYNYRWLKSKLKAEGVAVESSGDTEVLLKALSQRGETILSELDGMFAFAFYEANSRRVLLARDPFGIKPLYMSHSSRGGSSSRVKFGPCSPRASCPTTSIQQESPRISPTALRKNRSRYTRP